MRKVAKYIRSYDCCVLRYARTKQDTFEVGYDVALGKKGYWYGMLGYHKYLGRTKKEVVARLFVALPGWPDYDPVWHKIRKPK